MNDLASTIGLLRAAFPRQDFPEISVVVYAQALADLDPVAVRRAVDALIAREDWLPSIAKIRREAGEQTLDLPTPTEAWMQIQSPIGRAGASPPVKAALQAVGGSWALKITKADELERRFRRAYGDIREAAIRDFAETRPQSMLGSQTRQIEGSGADSFVAGEPVGNGARGLTAGASAPDTDSAPASLPHGESAADPSEAGANAAPVAGAE